MRIVLFILIVCFVTACSSPSKESKTVVDWTNFLEWNNQQYIGNPSLFVSTPSYMGKSVGTTSFHVQKHVQDASYQPKNGDAAFLPEGTTLHAVKNVSSKKVLAVSTQRVYTTKEFHLPSLKKATITRIHMMNEGKTVFSTTDPSTIDTIKSILEEGEAEDLPTTTSSPHSYFIYFTLASPLSLKYTLHELDGMFYLEKEKSIRLPEEFSFYVN